MGSRRRSCDGKTRIVTLQLHNLIEVDNFKSNSTRMSVIMIESLTPQDNTAPGPSFRILD